MIEIEMVADRNNDIARARAYGLESQLGFQLEVELVHFDVRNATASGTPLGNRKHNVKQNRESAASHGGHRLGEQVDYRNQKKGQGEQTEPDGNLHPEDAGIEGNLELALAGPGVTEHQNRQTVHGETPNHAEGVEVREEGDIATADYYGENLQNDDDIDNAIAGAEAGMRLAKPGTEHAILGNAIQHSVGADDSGVHRASKNQRTYHDHESVKDQAGIQRAFEVHGQAAD